MFDQIKKLIGHSAIYGIGVLSSGISVLIVTPMFLHLLRKSEYGAVDILNTYASMLVSVLLLGVASVLIKVYTNDCKDEQDRRALVGSVLAMTALTGLIVVLGTFLVPSLLSNMLLGSPRFVTVTKLASAYGALLMSQNIVLLCLRAKQWPSKFIAVNITQLVLIAGLNLYFVWYRRMGIVGVQIANVVAAGVATGLGLFFVRSLLVPRVSIAHLKHLLKVSMPVIPVAVAPWVLSASNRYFLRHLCGLDDTGLYAVGHKLGMVGMNMVINAFQLAWSPLFFANCTKEDAARFCASVWKYLAVTLMFAALAFSVFSREIVQIVSREEYWSAHWIAPFIALSYVFYGVHFFTVPIFIHRNRGKVLSLVMASVALMDLVLNYVLISRFGIRGAVAVALISYMLLAVVDTILANKFFPVEYPFLQVFKSVVVSFALFAVYHGIKITGPGTLVLKFTWMLAFPVLLYVLGFFSAQEKTAFRRVSLRVLRTAKLMRPA